MISKMRFRIIKDQFNGFSEEIGREVIDKHLLIESYYTNKGYYIQISNRLHINWNQQ
jgi:hypothetical protein